MDIAVSTSADSTGTRLVPALRYRDIGAAIDWLCAAFGFEQHRVVAGVDGTILNAQLTFGNDMIMLLPARGSDLDGTGGAEMQSCYFVVDDADLHHYNAKAAGADILDIKQYDFGGRGYSCRDPEGHIWNFGTHNPRQKKAAQRKQYDPWKKYPAYRRRGHAAPLAVWLRLAASLCDKLKPPVIVAATVAAVVAAATVGWMLVGLELPSGATGREKRLASTAKQLTDDVAENVARPSGEPAPVRSLAFGTTAAHQRSAEANARATRRAIDPAVEPSTEDTVGRGSRQTTELDQERVAKDAAERTAQEALKQLSRERSAKEAAELTAIEARKRLANTMQKTREQLANERAAKETLKRPGKEAQKRLAQELPAKTSAVETTDLPQSPERTADDPDLDCLPRSANGQVVCRLKDDKPALSAAREPAAPSAKLSAVEPARDLRQSPERTADEPIWDCLPNSVNGKVVCRPREKKPALGAGREPVTASAKLSAVEPARDLRQSPERTVEEPIWDCLPNSVSGQVVCRPSAGQGKR